MSFWASPMAGPVVGAASSLLGGLVGNSSTKKLSDRTFEQNKYLMKEGYYWNKAAMLDAIESNEAANIRAEGRANAYNDPAEQRARLEAAGFNPLGLVAGSAMSPSLSGVGASSIGVPSMAIPVDQMGSAIADAGMILADGIAKRQDLARAQAAEAKLAEANAKIQQQTLRPVVGGIYAQREAARSITQAIGVNNAQANRVGSNSVPYGGPTHNGSLDSVEPDTRAVSESLQSHGQSTPVTIGPDPDEWFSGQVIDANNRRKAANRFENSNEAKAGRAQRFAPTWPSQSKTAGQAFRFNWRPREEAKPKRWEWPVGTPNLGAFR